ncbi:hypothetical protein [Trichlorobacter ammonificans]|uniref:Eukaryotic translation initiation factor 3 135 kDa subunit n=1 Tax=Trichlorobacter ammonificans TaxID=2916410 RepID=A0ABM9DAT8_9BACT|nr:hypothetical protein [Trichlorobacter ammonificans]CAH2032358.1 Eukaryotic translation initiation factor 3 135 kDa subunit [Trichlorobacter ammonificans]
MNLRFDIALTVGGVLACLVVPLLVYQKVRFTPPLSVRERAVADFAPATLTIARKDWQNSTLALPVTPPAPPVPVAGTVPGKPEASAAAPAVAAAPVPRPALPKVSMILHDGSGGGTAIIDGTPLTVGGAFKGWRLERIEGSRVLLRGQRGTVWVSQE